MLKYNVEIIFLGGNNMQLYQCPNCGRTYNYGSETVIFNKQCMNCRYPLKKIEEVKQINNPELNQHNVIGNINNNKLSPKCPTCQSINIRKMGGVERGASIWAFGLFSKKINKTFKCNNCGYTW